MAGKRKRHDEALLARCVARVLAGERPAGVAEQAGIPYSTLMTRVTWKKRGQEPVTAATRKKKRSNRASASGEDASAAAPESGEPPTELPKEAEADLLAWMARLQRAHICVRRRDVLDKANGILAALGGAPELGAVWFTRFRERHSEVTGHGTNLVVAEEAMAGIEAAREKVTDGEAAAPWAAILDPTPVNNPKHQEETMETSEDTVVGSAPSDSSGASAEAAEPSPPQAAEDDDTLEMTPSERAVALLQECYSEKLAPVDLAEAFDVALDPRKAKLLLVLRPGELRDLWIARQIEKRRRAEAATAAAAGPQESAAATVV